MKSTKYWTSFSAKSSDLLGGFAIVGIKAYQVTLGPYIGGSCRFYPSCSHYAVDAYTNHSPLMATKFVLKRLSRCHPLGSHGYDPVPTKATTKGNLNEI